MSASSKPKQITGQKPRRDLLRLFLHLSVAGTAAFSLTGCLLKFAAGRGIQTLSPSPGMIDVAKKTGEAVDILDTNKKNQRRATEDDWTNMPGDEAPADPYAGMDPYDKNKLAGLEGKANDPDVGPNVQRQINDIYTSYGKPPPYKAAVRPPTPKPPTVVQNKPAMPKKPKVPPLGGTRHGAGGARHGGGTPAPAGGGRHGGSRHGGLPF